MAFIRQYMEAGDPFRFRLPRMIRPSKKLKHAFGKVGRGIGKVAGLGASLLPGPLSIVGSAIMARRGGQPAGIEDQLAEPVAAPECPPGFARGYGMDEGDPAPGRRKSAGAGPRAKAEKKAAKRAAPGGLTGPQKRRAKGGSAGRAILGGIGTGFRTVGQAIPGLISATKQGGPLAGMFHMVTTGPGAGAAPGAFGRSHRRVNPANVKALRRSVRRLDSFERLVKSVRKSARGLREVVGVTHPRAFHARKKGR